MLVYFIWIVRLAGADLAGRQTKKKIKAEAVQQI